MPGSASDGSLGGPAHPCSRIRQLIAATPPGGVARISAAPGYGATSAMAEAVRASGSPLAWVSLAPTQGADAVWERVREAVAGPEHRHTGGLPRSGADNVEWVLERLDRTEPSWLVLDGLDVSRHVDLMSVLPLLCRGLPAGTRLGITSHQRVDLALPGASDRVVSLDETELALLPDEAVDVLRAIAPGMDIEVVSEIVSLAEGWVAALRAGAQRAQRHGEGLATRWLAGPGVDTLFGGWFAELAQPAADFLLDTAVLDVLEARACDAVRDASGSAALLSELAAMHAYVREDLDPRAQALPERPTPAATLLGSRVWRRHGLLTRFLRSRSVPGPDSPTRHLRAAEHFRGERAVDAAMSHYVSAGLTRQAGRYLAEVESELIASGRAGRALDWYQALPQDTWDDRIAHLLRIGWARAIAGDARGADLVLAQIAVQLRAGGSDLGEQTAAPNSGERPGAAFAATDGEPATLWDAHQATAEFDVLTAYVAGYDGDPATMIAASQRAIAGFAGHYRSEGAQLAPLLLLRGLVWAGQIEPALTQLAGIQRWNLANDAIREVSLAGVIAKCEVLAGRVHAGLRTADRAIDWLARQGLTPRDTGSFGPLIARGLALMESADLAGAQECLELAVPETAERGQVGDQVYALATLVRLHTLRRDWDCALETLAQARAALQRSCPSSLMFTLLAQGDAALRLASGDLERARALTRDLPACAERSLLWVAANLRGNESAVRRTLTALNPPTMRIAAGRQILLAAAELPRGRRLAEGHLLRAVEIAHACGMATLLCTAPDNVNELADELHRDSAGEGLAWLVAARDSVRAARPLSAERSRPGLLSPGELELIALLPSRHTNADLALRLGVSANTIKTRLRRLYAKLGVNSRDAAIVKARELGIRLPDHSVADHR